MKKEMTDVFEDERLNPYEILIEAKGEADYYDKVLLVAEIEKCYDELEIGTIKSKRSYATTAKIMIKEFMITFDDMKKETQK